MEYPLWSLLPFVAMLASIAVLPLIPATSHWWERNSSQLTVALVLAVPTTLWMFWKAGSAPLIDTGIEYFQFICLLFSLYVVSGGIHLAGDIRATPRNNTIFLAIGGVLASFIGTTGAAMLLIRPLLATNRERVNKVHTVLFTIFIVANCGGLLTPLGDPPLFLGFLNGVPFTWTLNLWKEWAFVLGILLLSYYSLDRLYYASEPKAAIEEDNEDIEAIIEGHAHGSELVPWREVVMLIAAGLSLTVGNKKVRYEENAFQWSPIAEVAALFIGIFATMAPALRVLEEVAPSLPLNRGTFFVFTGSLSSVLDNAPTYMTFFGMAKTLGGDGTLIAGVPEAYLIPISLGAVFCGAITYIGNGPNFMVKSVAEADGIEMPSFGRYIVDSFMLLVPELAAMAMIFVGSGWVRIAGIAVAVVLVGISFWRIARARTIELATRTQGIDA